MSSFRFCAAPRAIEVLLGGRFDLGFGFAFGFGFALAFDATLGFFTDFLLPPLLPAAALFVLVEVEVDFTVLFFAGARPVCAFGRPTGFVAVSGSQLDALDENARTDFTPRM